MAERKHKQAQQHVESGSVTVERIFNAPVEKVWKALTDKEQIKRWSFAVTDFKPEVGFKFEFSANKDGMDYLHKSVVKEAVPNKKLSYSWRYEGYEGDSLVTIELSAENGKTRLKLTHTGLETFPKSNADFDRANFLAGWTQIIGTSLKEYVENHFPDTTEFTITRIFDAPRALVWKAWTVPEMMAQWWGPKGLKVGKYTMDLRPGGNYHYSMRTPDGAEMWGKFTYREVVAPELLLFVNSFSDAQGNATRHPMSPTWPLYILSTIRLTETAGKTEVGIHWTPLDATKQECKTFSDGMAGMHQGWGGTLDQLQEFLKQQR